MPIEHELNPAGRLWLFVEHTRLQPPDATLRKVWERYLGIDSPDGQLYTEAIADVLSLPRLARLAIDSLTDPPLSKDTLLEPLPHMTGLLLDHAPAHGQVSSFANALDLGALRGLRVSSEVLNGQLRRSGLSPNVVSRLRERLADLLKVVGSDPDVEPVLRRVLLSHIERMIWLLDRYNVSGPDGLTDEIDRFQAAVARVPRRDRKEHHVVEWLLRAGTAIVVATQLYAVPLQIASSTADYVAEIEELLGDPIETIAPGDSDDTVIAEIVADHDESGRA